MSALLRCLTVALALLAGVAPEIVLADGPGVRIDPNFPPLGGGSSRGGYSDRAPRGYDNDDDYRRRSQRPQIYCDNYGRCFQRVPDRSQGFDTRPPGWADDLPGRARYSDRFSRPSSGVVCDQSTNVCYRNGRIDRSETRDAFGNRAAERADDLRDRRGTAQLFVPERGVSCDSSRRICYDGRTPDVSLTRRYFGADAATQLD